MVVGFIQKSYETELADGDEPDCVDYWLKLGKYYSSYIGRFGDESPRESVHLSDIDVSFDRTENLKEFISDIVFLFEKMLKDINEVIQEVASDPKGKDGVEDDIYNLCQKNQKTIPVIIKYYTELLKFSEGKTFEEINKFATYSPENVNFTAKMIEAINFFQQFLEKCNEKIVDHNQFMSDCSDELSDKCNGLSDDILIHNITKKFHEIVESILINKNNFIQNLRKQNAQPYSNEIMIGIMKDLVDLINKFTNDHSQLNDMKNSILEIFTKRSQTVDSSPQLDIKYNEITLEIKEKYDNDPIKWGNENKDKQVQAAYKYGIHKSLYKSIITRINHCESFLSELDKIYKVYKKNNPNMLDMGIDGTKV